MRPMLVLRPQPGAAATAARIESLGLRAVVAPLFAARPLVWTAAPASAFDRLLLTSAATLRHAGPALAAYRDLPVVAVGPATAQAARQAGFRTVEDGGGSVSAAAGQLVATGARRVLHLGGLHHVEAVAPGLDVRHVAVYAMDSCPAPAALSDALRADAVALLHSARAARRFGDLVPAADRLRVGIAAISPVVLAAAGAGWRDRIAAPVPTDASLVASAAALVRAD